VEFEELDAETAANVAHWRVVNTGVAKPMVAHVRVDAAESKIVVETTGNGTMLIFR